MVKGYTLYDLVVIGFKGKAIYMLIVEVSNDYMVYEEDLLKVKCLKDYKDSFLYDYGLEIISVENHTNKVLHSLWVIFSRVDSDCK